MFCLLLKVTKKLTEKRLSGIWFKGINTVSFYIFVFLSVMFRLFCFPVLKKDKNVSD